MWRVSVDLVHSAARASAASCRARGASCCECASLLRRFRHVPGLITLSLTVVVLCTSAHAASMKVSQMLLEFTHKYVAEVVSDASTYQQHAGKTEIDIDDLRLAIQVATPLSPLPARPAGHARLCGRRARMRFGQS